MGPAPSPCGILSCVDPAVLLWGLSSGLSLQNISSALPVGHEVLNREIILGAVLPVLGRNRSSCCGMRLPRAHEARVCQVGAGEPGGDGSIQGASQGMGEGWDGMGCQLWAGVLLPVWAAAAASAVGSPCAGLRLHPLLPWILNLSCSAATHCPQSRGQRLVQHVPPALCTLSPFILALFHLHCEKSWEWLPVAAGTFWVSAWAAGLILPCCGGRCAGTAGSSARLLEEMQRRLHHQAGAVPVVPSLCALGNCSARSQPRVWLQQAGCAAHGELLLQRKKALPHRDGAAGAVCRMDVCCWWGPK